jgi:two-component system, chemotaxis family, protein-glutamate methylesterase/glutaminase
LNRQVHTNTNTNTKEKKGLLTLTTSASTLATGISSSGAFGVVAIGASLGGIEAVGRLLSLLPSDFGAAIVLTQHLNPSYPSQLAAILDRQSALAVKWAVGGEKLRPAKVYVAPPGEHLLVNADGTLDLARVGVQELYRPSVTTMFEMVARSYGKRAIGVVLTGLGKDGAEGVRHLKQQGGRVLVQSPETCIGTGMPQAAIRTGCIDFVLPLQGLANALTTLVMVRGASDFFRVIHAPLPNSKRVISNPKR